jgi:uncharacterized membrane protein YfcA
VTYVVICAVALIASALTFFSGFGLGTLLLPAFALFFAVERAVALTAVVHFLNGAFKLYLVWRHIDRPTAVRFGVPAIAGGLAGGWALLRLADIPAIATYEFLGRSMEITPVKLMIGVLLLLFACAELLPSFGRLSFPVGSQPLGGLLSGFFGGLSGMQGALRSAFLVKAGLSKEAFVATGSAIGFLIDISRLSMYSRLLMDRRSELDYGLLGAAILAAFAGALLGNRYLPKITMTRIQSIVAILLFVVALGLIFGML